MSEAKTSRRRSWKKTLRVHNHARLTRREQRGNMMEDRLDALISAKRASGLSLDLLDELTQGLDSHAFLTVMGNASSSPSISQSRGNPNRCLIARAPLSESL